MQRKKYTIQIYNPLKNWWADDKEAKYRSNPFFWDLGAIFTLGNDINFEAAPSACLIHTNSSISARIFTRGQSPCNILFTWYKCRKHSKSFSSSCDYCSYYGFGGMKVKILGCLFLFVLQLHSRMPAMTLEKTIFRHCS